MFDKKDISKALQTQAFESLYDLAATKRSKLHEQENNANTTSAPAMSQKIEVLPEPTSNAKTLGYDICIFIDSQFNERQQRLNVSARDIEKAKTELINLQLVKEIWLGKSLMLAGSSKLYKYLGLESPYKRNVSDIHSFLVLLTTKLVEANPLVKNTIPEASLGDSSSTVDLLVHMKNSQRWAYEITWSESNCCANAAKLIGKGFAQIIFVCKDYDLMQTVWTRIRNTGFEPDFLSTIRCTIFGKLISQKKQFTLRRS